MASAVRNDNYNTRFQNISGVLSVAAADTSSTLVTNPNTSYSIFIQKLRVRVKTDAAQTAKFEDSATTPRIVAALISNPGVGNQAWDFGPEGFQLNEGKNFVLTLSAAGLALEVSWEGYMRPTAASRAASAL